MNIVIPFRNTCGNDELKMCVKLIKKNLMVDYDHIYIIGDDCGFSYPNIINIKVEEQKYNKWLDSNFLVSYYITNISNESFILFNDDFFITGKIDKIPLYFNNVLSERLLTTYIVDEKINKLRLSSYGLNISKFIKEFGDFYNYEVHIPMIIKYPDIMQKAIKISKEFDCPALKRTLYMYLLKDESCLDITSRNCYNDIKFGEPYKIIQYPFFSLTDKEFKVFEKDFENLLEEE